MMSERVGDGFSHGGNVFSRRGAACAEFSQSILSMLLPFGRVGVGRCVSKLKSEEASGEQKLACAIPSAEAFRAKLKERLPLGRLYVVLEAILAPSLWEGGG